MPLANGPELAQPRQLIVAEVFNLPPTCAAGDDRAHHQEHDVDQIMLAVDVTTMVFDD